MRAVTKVGGLVLLALLGGSAALACAASDPDAAPSDSPPPAPLETGDPNLDAAPDTDLIDAGPCSDSGLCAVPVPIDTRINVMSISGSSASDVWAVGTSRTVLHWDGTAWLKADTIEVDASPYTLRSVWAGGPNDVWITDGPELRHTTGWKGPSATEWSRFALANVDTGAMPAAIGGKDGRVFIARQVFYLGGPRDPRLVTCTGWDAGPIEPYYVPSDLHLGYRTEGLWTIAVTRSDEAWATNIPVVDRTERTLPHDLPGNRVVRAYLAEGDAGWQVEEHDSRVGKNLYAVWGNEQVVWLVGEGGVLRRMTRDRVTSRVFESIASPVTSDLRGVYGLAANDIWAVGDDATVVHWDGTTWTRVPTPFDTLNDKPRLLSVWGSAPNDVWIGGNGVMLHYAGKAQ